MRRRGTSGAAAGTRGSDPPGTRGIAGRLTRARCRRALRRVDADDRVEPAEADVEGRVGGQLDDLRLREVRAQLGPEGVVDLVMVHGQLFDEADGRALARAQQVRGLVVDGRDPGLTHAGMPGPGIADGESVATVVE